MPERKRTVWGHDRILLVFNDKFGCVLIVVLEPFTTGGNTTMFHRKFITAGTLCLSLAASTVLAQATTNPGSTPLPASNAKSSAKVKTKKPTASSVTPSQVQSANTNTTVPSGQFVTADSSSTASAPNPVNVASKFGLGGKSRIKINGFLSAGASKTDTAANYNIPGHGSINNKFNFTTNSLAGIQITGNMTQQLSAVIQLVADGDDINGNSPYRINAEWAFLRYAPFESLQFRAGRFRIPAFMYSNTEEIGYTYPWVFLPPEVYRIVPFDNMNGFDMISTVNLGNSGWYLQLQPFVGQNQSKFDLYTNAPAALLPPGTTATFDENDIIGGVVTLGNQYLTLRGNYTRVRLNGYIPNLSTVGGQQVNLFNNQETNFYSLGAKFDYQNVLMVGEYAHRETPDQIASLTGYYGMVGYRIGKLLPNFTYARLRTTNAAQLLVTQPFAELPQDQYSYTLGAAYYINSNLVAKVGVSQITPTNGTNGLFQTAPGDRHVYLYSVSLDAIF